MDGGGCSCQDSFEVRRRVAHGAWKGDRDPNFSSEHPSEREEPTEPLKVVPTPKAKARLAVTSAPGRAFYTCSHWSHIGIIR